MQRLSECTASSHARERFSRRATTHLQDLATAVISLAGASIGWLANVLAAVGGRPQIASGPASALDPFRSEGLGRLGLPFGVTGESRNFNGQGRTKAENTVQANEAQLRRFIDDAPVAVAMFDRDMLYMAVSGRYISDYNLQSANLIGRSHYEIFPEIPTPWREVHQRCLLGAVERSEGERFVRGDGSHQWIRWEIQPWRDPQGEIGGIVLFTEDITARKEAEAALFREKERALITLHSIGDAVITTGATGTIDYLNPIAEHLTGWTCAEAQGRALGEVFRILDEETQTPAVDPVASCLHQGRPTKFADAILTDRSGHQWTIENSASPIRKPDGEVLGAVLVFHDVTETKRVARQLQYDAAHDALTGLVNRREFERRLERAVESARGSWIDHALCYIDLDRFKRVNDVAGHAAGDALLKRVRGLLAGIFRERDTLARLGGDEFALLLETCGPGEALRIAQTIVSAFRDWRFSWEGRSFHVGASVGVVPITFRSASAAEILNEADKACYAAKRRGSGRVHLHRENLPLPASVTIRPRTVRHFADATIHDVAQHLPPFPVSEDARSETLIGPRRAGPSTGPGDVRDLAKPATPARAATNNAPVTAQRRTSIAHRSGRTQAR